ncbi:MAG: MarR family transcriptional regulator [Cytophagaceae bacterium]|nr:MAG: MarR family transcriptional regulator [Cytophagaceae bacterium]
MSSPDSFTAFADSLALTGSAFRAYIRQRLKACSLDLTTEMTQVLRYLWAHDHVNQQEIANAVNRDKASLTSLLDNLERRELVERQADSHDRRNNRIVLTSKGRALEHAVAPLVQQMYAVASQGFSEDQLRTSIAMLAQMTQNLTQAEK